MCIYNVIMIQLEEKELYWLAGILEGEGYFGPQKENNYTTIAVQMTDEDVIQKISNIFGTSYFKINRRQEHHKDSFSVSLRGKKALELMLKIKPIMSIRRQQKIEECQNSFVDNSKIIKEEDYQEIYKLKQSGISAQEIGEIYGVTKWAIYRVLQKVGGA